MVLELKQPYIVIEDVDKEINQNNNRLVVLHELNLEVNHGSSVAIKGVSGSGKTTLLKLLASLEAPTSGNIKVGGTDLTELNEAQKARFRREQVGFIFQNFQLLPNLTALENVMLALELQREERVDAICSQAFKAKVKPSSNVVQAQGSEAKGSNQETETKVEKLIYKIFGNRQAKAIRERAIEILNYVGLTKRLHHYPNQLSGGEQQRVAIARCFIVQPKLLLADEPTANIEQNTAQIIVDLLFKLQEEFNNTLVMVTHDPVLAAKCRDQYLLEEGKLFIAN